MCTGPTHVLAGAAAGAAVAQDFMHLPPAGVAAVALYAGAFATVNDLDKRGSCASLSLGWLSTLAAVAVNKVSGGHRHLTHTIPGALTIAALVFAGVWWRDTLPGRAGLALLLAFAFAGAARAFRLAGHGGDVAGAGLAVVMAATGWGLAWAGTGALIGALAHIAADGFTCEGVPLWWPAVAEDHHARFLPGRLAFTTGTRPERAFRAGIVGALGLLAGQVLATALIP